MIAVMGFWCSRNQRWIPNDDYQGETVPIAQEVVDENGPDKIAVMGFWCSRNQRWIPNDDYQGSLSKTTG